MKLMALLGVGALVAGTVTALPVAAQRYDHGYRDGYRGHDGYRGGPGYRHHGYRGGYDHRGYRGGYGYRGDYGYRGPRHGWRGYRGRPRVVCRVHRGYYGPERRCFQAY
ncbi:hypothetical protein SAMN05192583_0204 [Sphingomonas gellani]|uniref:Uncharacterized protein n=1 Tax=Sphingomonas gellani TaxID=1166340 RepID=A0A1H7YBV4_9SPHN|nr:hypothetical protein [Sphingomonas gellani]SEM43672.1 hypothetical protein SAMN05192583_0204 [Sphingomonas gellani]